MLRDLLNSCYLGEWYEEHRILTNNLYCFVGLFFFFGGGGVVGNKPNIKCFDKTKIKQIFLAGVLNFNFFVERKCML